MTREEKIEIFTMRLDGNSYQEIADKKGKSKQYIQQALTSIVNPRKQAIKGVKYPYILGWLHDNECSISVFAEKIGISGTGLRQKLKGEREFKIAEIKKICEITELSFEDVFKTDNSHINQKLDSRY